MLKIPSTTRECSLCSWHEGFGIESFFASDDVWAVMQWLRYYKSEATAMVVLRQAASHYGDHDLAPSGSDDEQVLEHLAALIASGRVRVIGETPAATKGKGGGGAPAPAPVPPPPRPSPRPPPPQPPPPPPPPAPVEQKGDLLVEVFDDQGNLIVEQVEITASGPESLKQVTNTGTHTFTGVALGTYTAVARVPSERFDADTRSTGSTPVTAGGTGRARLEFKWLLNIVTPKVEVEYKVVLFDRRLSAQQAAGETKIVTDSVTRVELSATEATGSPKYVGGGLFEVSPARVEVFRDEACTTPLAGKIPKAELMPGPLKLYLRAKTPGRFTAKLTMDPSGNGRVTVKGPAQEEMGVVELQTVLHRYDKAALGALKVDPANDPAATYHAKLEALALPEQKPLTDGQKVKEGRFLHLQSGKNHDRARLLVKKLTSSEWPAGTDEYEIVLNAAGGAVSLFDKKVDGTKSALPHKITVKDLKAADLEFWVEGSAESAALRDVVLEAGLDRQAGGLAHKAKHNGDWSRLTVVKIASVELVASVTAGKPKVWDSAEKRYFINTEAGAAGRTLGPKAGARDVKVVATLGKAIAGVPIHLMLAPAEGNAAPAGMPATWKAEALKVALRALDRTDRKALMHFSALSGADGKAEIKTLVLSAFAGDHFTPGAYIEQDPHLAKYVQGHADLGARMPTLSSTTLQVWKHFDYRIVFMKRHDGTSYSNRLSEDDLKARFANDFIEMERKGAVVEAAHEDLVAYNDARNWVIGKLGAEEPRVLQFAFVDAIGKTPQQDLDVSRVGLTSLSFSIPITGGHCFDMSAQAKWLKTATCGKTGLHQPIPAAKIALQNDGVNHKVVIDLTGMAHLAGVPLADIDVNLVLKEHDFPSGLSWGAPTLIGMRWRESVFASKEAEATMRTTYHEAGHYMGLAPKTLPDTAATASTQWYNSPGVGNHCKFGPQNCTMWHSFILKIDFCPTCRLALRARDHATNANAASPF